MTAENRAKDFAFFLIIHTEEVTTLGACRRYKGKVLNVDELYTAWEEFKAKNLQKY